MQPEFLDEDIMVLFEEEVEEEEMDKWVVWFDGGSNASGHGVATYPFAGERGDAHRCVFHGRKMRGVATNVYSKENVRKTKGNWS